MVTQNFASTGGAVARDTGAATSSVNAAPVVEMADITVSGETGRGLGQGRISRRQRPGRHEIVYYEVRDQQGRHNFKLKGDGVINARDGYVIDAESCPAPRRPRDGALATAASRSAPRTATTGRLGGVHAAHRLRRRLLRLSPRGPAQAGAGAGARIWPRLAP